MGRRRDDRPLRATVSGSFTESIGDVQKVVAGLAERRVEILSPTDPQPVERLCDFVYVASDVERTIRVLQLRHFAAIEQSDFLWLCTPSSGRLGESTTAEIHHANLFGVPVFTENVPASLYWRQTVTTTSGVDAALALIDAAFELKFDESISSGGRVSGPDLLVDPRAATERLHNLTENVADRLLTRRAPEVDDPQLWAWLNAIREIAKFPAGHLS
jgi:hypothetical protein